MSFNVKPHPIIKKSSEMLVMKIPNTSPITIDRPKPISAMPAKKDVSIILESCLSLIIIIDFLIKFMLKCF